MWHHMIINYWKVESKPNIVLFDMNWRLLTLLRYCNITDSHRSKTASLRSCAVLTGWTFCPACSEEEKSWWSSPRGFMLDCLSLTAADFLESLTAIHSPPCVFISTSNTRSRVSLWQTVRANCQSFIGMVFKWFHPPTLNKTDANRSTEPWGGPGTMQGNKARN